MDDELGGGGGCLVIDDFNFLVGVLGRGRGHNLLFIIDDLGVFDLIVPLTPNRAICDDKQDPDHPQKDTNAASDDESDGTTFPWAQGHECLVNAPRKRSAAVLELLALALALGVMMMMMVLVVLLLLALHLTLYLARFVGRGANERHGQNTDETTMNFLLTIGGWVRVNFDGGET